MANFAGIAAIIQNNCDPVLNLLLRKSEFFAVLPDWVPLLV